MKQFILYCIFWVIGISVIIWHPNIYAEKNRNISLPVAVLLNQVSSLTYQNKCREVVRLLESDTHSHYLLNFALGNCYLETSKTEQAIQQYQKVLTLKPDYFPAWSNLAKSFYDLKNYLNAAESFFHGYHYSNPKNGQFLYFSAVAYQAGHQPQKAIKIFHLLMDHHPELIQLQWKELLIQSLFSLERNREALPYIEEIIEKSENIQRVKAWEETLLYQYITLEMVKKATVLAEKLVIKEPLKPKWWKTLSHLKLAVKDYKETLVAMTIYSELTSLSQNEQKLLAFLNLKLNIPRQSIQLYEQILSKSVKPEIVTGLVHSYLKLQQPEAALKWTRIGLKNFEDTSLRIIKANLLVKMEAYQEASEDYQILTADHPKNGQYWLMLGYTAFKSENRKLAISALKKAITFPEQKQAARSILKQIART